MAPKTLNFITGNSNKLAEVQAILGNAVDLKNQSLDLIEIQGTIEEVSTDKCRRAAHLVWDYITNQYPISKILQINGPVLVEDTCLCFNALGQLPGPYVWAFRLKAHPGLALTPCTQKMVHGSYRPYRVEQYAGCVLGQVCASSLHLCLLWRSWPWAHNIPRSNGRKH